MVEKRKHLENFRKKRDPRMGWFGNTIREEVIRQKTSEKSSEGRTKIEESSQKLTRPAVSGRGEEKLLSERQAPRRKHPLKRLSPRRGD